MTKSDLMRVIERQNKTIISQNDTIDRMEERASLLLAEIEKANNDNKWLRRKLNAARDV